MLTDIRLMLANLGIRSADFSADLFDAYGRKQPGFNLPKRETLILVSGYDVSMRARIIDRWQELEAVPKFVIQQNLPDALRQAAGLLSKQMQEVKWLEGWKYRRPLMAGYPIRGRGVNRTQETPNATPEGRDPESAARAVQAQRATCVEPWR